MRLEVEVGGRVRVVEIEHRGAALVIRLDGRERIVDAAEAAGRWSIRFPESGEQHAAILTPAREPGAVDVLINGLSIPVRLRAGAGVSSRGPARPASSGRITAPMPGKVVKVLVGL